MLLSAFVLLTVLNYFCQHWHPAHLPKEGMRAGQETSCPCATEGMCAGQGTPAEGVPTSQLGQKALLKSPANTGTHTEE